MTYKQNRAAYAAQIQAKRERDSRGTRTVIQPSTRSYAGQSKRSHKRNPADKGQGLWRTVSMYANDGRFNHGY